MELAPVGEIENLDELDVEPITVPIVGYSIPGKKKVVTRIRFRPTIPLAAAIDLAAATRANGNVPHAAVMRWVEASVLPDEIEAWREMISRADLAIEPETIVAVYQQLAEVYTARPTLRFSDSPGGSSSANGTSRAAARSRGSRKSGDSQPGED